MKRWPLVIVIGLAVGVALHIMLSVPCNAHRPLFPASPNTNIGYAMEIKDPEISWTVYTDLAVPREVDYYRMEFVKGQKFFAQIVIPQVAGLETFKPSFALIGPGLPVPTARTPFQLPAGCGAVIMPYQGVTEPFYEPFTQTRYWQLQSYELRVPVDGTYYVAVWDDSGRTGKYVLAIGKKEMWGIRDLFRFPTIWRSVRRWFKA